MEVFFEAGVEGVTSFTSVELSASQCNEKYIVLYVRQLNCFVMFNWDLGPVMLVLVQMKEHVHILPVCPWCSWGWLMQERSHQYVTDVGIMFVLYVISNSMTVIDYGSELVGKKGCGKCGHLVCNDWVIVV